MNPWGEGVGTTSSTLKPFFYSAQKVGFFNQQYADQLNMDEAATEYLMRNFNLPYQDSRKCLGRFGLESHAHTIQISKLSGTPSSVMDRTRPHFTCLHQCCLYIVFTLFSPFRWSEGQGRVCRALVSPAWCSHFGTLALWTVCVCTEWGCLYDWWFNVLLFSC